MLCYKATSIHQQSKRKQLKRRINYVASCLPGVRRIADAGTERSGTEGERPSYLSADDPRRLRYAQPPRGALNPSGRARGGLRWRPQAAGAGPRRRGHGRRLPNGCSPPASSSGSTMERVSGFWSLVNIRATANSDDGEGSLRARLNWSGPGRPFYLIRRKAAYLYIKKKNRVLHPTRAESGRAGLVLPGHGPARHSFFPFFSFVICDY